jgi:hypothetical protein
MINNPEFIHNVYRCNSIVARYLIYNLHFPVLAIKNNVYYFINNQELKEKLKGLPLWLKIFKIL